MIKRQLQTANGINWFKDWHWKWKWGRPTSTLAPTTYNRTSTCNLLLYKDNEEDVYIIRMIYLSLSVWLCILRVRRTCDCTAKLQREPYTARNACQRGLSWPCKLQPSQINFLASGPVVLQNVLFHGPLSLSLSFPL